MAQFIELKVAFLALPLTFCAVQARAQSLETLPQAPNLPPFRWFASTDSKHRNNDYVMLKPGETRRVPLAAGTLKRLWSTALFPNQTEIALETAPNKRQVLLSNGQAQRGLLVDKTFSFFPTPKSAPLANLENGAAIIVTNRAASENKWFYQAAVRPKTSTSSAPKAKSVTRRSFKIQLAAGESKVVETFDSPGQITEISIGSDRIGADRKGATIFRNLRLKIRFDGQDAVDAPLLSLGGSEAGDGNFRSAVADFDGSKLVLRWPMPFQKAEITLKNTNDGPLQLDVAARVSSFDQVPSPYRFCAQTRAAVTKKGAPVSILDIKSAGALVGLSLSIAPGEGAVRRTFAYLEGNETISADDVKFEGTGTEDFFSSAWYFPDQPFSRPFEGLTQKIAAPPSVSAYRWLIADAIPFKRSLKFDFEQGSGNNSEGMKWQYTAFWYQKPPLPALAKAPERVAAKSVAAAPNERWKLVLAVGAGVILGVVSALFKRRKRLSAR